MYQQDILGTSDETPTNFNDAPLQIYTANGLNATEWRGFMVQIDAYHAPTHTPYNREQPFFAEFTINFSVRQWLQTTSLKSEHLLGFNSVGEGPHSNPNIKLPLCYGINHEVLGDKPNSYLPKKCGKPLALVNTVQQIREEESDPDRDEKHRMGRFTESS